MQVIGIPLADAPEAGPAEEEKVFKAEVDCARAYLESAADRIRPAGLSVRIVVARGDADSEILGFAHRENSYNFV